MNTLLSFKRVEKQRMWKDFLGILEFEFSSIINLFVYSTRIVINVLNVVVNVVVNVTVNVVVNVVVNVSSFE